jgi:hypothetical protein
MDNLMKVMLLFLLPIYGFHDLFHFHAGTIKASV